MTTLREAAQRLVDRIDSEGATPLDWWQYDELVNALEKQAEPVTQCSFPKCQTTGGCVGACTRSTQPVPAASRAIEAAHHIKE